MARNLDDLAGVVDDLARRYAKAFAMAILSTSDRAEERAPAIARGGLPGVRRILAGIISDIEAAERRVDALAPTACEDNLAMLIETARSLNDLSAAIEAIRSADVDDGRILAILADPLAEQLPLYALALCGATKVTAAQAIEALRTVAINGGARPAVDPGGARLQ
jgi:hypothetical protein